MEEVALVTIAYRDRTAFLANSEADSFDSADVDDRLKADPPSMDGVHDSRDQGVTGNRTTNTSNNLIIIPWGVGDEGDAGVIRLYGWRLGTLSWKALLLAEFSFTLGSRTGVAGGDVPATARYADAITLVTGNVNVDTSVLAPGAGEKAHVVIDLKGHPVYQMAATVDTATSVNALVIPL